MAVMGGGPGDGWRERWRDGERDIDGAIASEGGGRPPQLRMSFSHPDTTQ